MGRVGARIRELVLEAAEKEISISQLRVLVEVLVEPVGELLAERRGFKNERELQSGIQGMNLEIGRAHV